MDKIQRLKQEKQYEEYVKQKTPQHNVWLNMLKAFLLGGTICFIGQVINHYCELKKLSADDCSSWTSLLLVLLSVLLTGTGIYPRLAKWGGAGALVPITGFANSVAAPAIEYKKEGQVFGIGCKIFTIAGPVILYGIFTSWGLGVLYWLGTLIGCICSRRRQSRQRRGWRPFSISGAVSYSSRPYPVTQSPPIFIFLSTLFLTSPVIMCFPSSISLFSSIHSIIKSLLVLQWTGI